VITAVASCGVRCRVMSLVLAGLAGALFGAGLLLSGMTRPERVIGFLDVTGAWNPSLAFVMGGALAVYAVATRLVRRRRGEPWFDATFHLPTRRDVDARLLVGAAIFGVGWGIGGVCPGPGLVALGAGSADAIAFVVAMVAGLALQRRLVQPIGVHSSTSTPSGSRT
jgi:uncharacterized membrane protein YedE/YeeE